MTIEHPNIRGHTTNEKFASVEATLKSLFRRVAKKATVYIPPVPFFINMEVMPASSTIGKLIVPFNGTLKDVFIRVGELSSRAYIIRLEIVTDAATTKMTFEINKKSQRLEVGMDIDAGTLLILTLEEGDISDIIIAAAVVPRLDEHVAKQLLIEGTENAIQEKEE